MLRLLSPKRGLSSGAPRTCRGPRPTIKGVKFGGFFINQLDPLIIMINIKLSIEALKSLLNTVIFHYEKLPL